MTKRAFLTAAVMTALAFPAGAQTLAATPSTTASSAVLVASEQVLSQPSLRERRALVMAAFERPPAARRPDALQRQPVTFEAPALEPKEEWTSDEGLRMKGAQLAFKTRF
jgi:hypothetical protein